MNNRNNVFSVDVSPEMQIYKILQHLNYNLETAYAEFIDNSIQSFLDNRNRLDDISGKSKSKLKITIDVSSSDNQIIIKDDAGGISRNDMDRALKLGVNIGSVHSHKSLSVYGIGMKSAAIWFTDDWSIVTSSLGSSERLSFNFNLNDFLNENRTRADVISTPDDDSSHFTEIILRKQLRSESREHYEDSVIPFILETFMKFRDFVSIEFYYDEKRIFPNVKKLSLDTPEVMEYPPVDNKGYIDKHCIVKWMLPISFNYDGRDVSGFVMLRKTGSYGQPGLRLLRNGRVIEGTSVYPNIPETLLKTKNKYTAQRIYGELNLNSFPVDFMKTNFNENLKGMYVRLQEIITSSYNFDILFQADNFRKKVADSSESKVLFQKIIESGIYVNIGEKESILPSLSDPITKDSIVLPPEPKKDPKNGEDNNTLSGSGGGDKELKPVDDNSQKKDSNNNDQLGGQRYEPLPENRIEYSLIFHQTLEKLTGNKAGCLYDSLCTVSLKKHSVLCYVGTWSFLEMLTALLGRNANSSFPDYLGTKINEYTTDKNKRTELKRVISDISTRGNCTKHSGIYWNHTAMDLKPAFIILEPFLIDLIENHIKSKT